MQSPPSCAGVADGDLPKRYGILNVNQPYQSEAPVKRILEPAWLQEKYSGQWAQNLYHGAQLSETAAAGWCSILNYVVRDQLCHFAMDMGSTAVDDDSFGFTAPRGPVFQHGQLLVQAGTFVDEKGALYEGEWREGRKNTARNRGHLRSRRKVTFRFGPGKIYAASAREVPWRGKAREPRRDLHGHFRSQSLRTQGMARGQASALAAALRKKP